MARPAGPGQQLLATDSAKLRCVPYPLWNYSPRNVRPPEWVNGLVETVAGVSGTISTVEQRTGLRSDDVLRELTPGLTSLGYVVESGKSKAAKIFRPVLLGDNGMPEL